MPELATEIPPAEEEKESMPTMGFLDHLEELRWRILYSLLGLVVAVILAFVIVIKLDLLYVLQRPIAPLLAGHKLVYTHPGDPFA